MHRKALTPLHWNTRVTRERPQRRPSSEESSTSSLSSQIELREGVEAPKVILKVPARAEQSTSRLKLHSKKASFRSTSRAVVAVAAWLQPLPRLLVAASAGSVNLQNGRPSFFVRSPYLCGSLALLTSASVSQPASASPHRPRRRGRGDENHPAVDLVVGSYCSSGDSSLRPAPLVEAQDGAGLWRWRSLPRVPCRSVPFGDGPEEQGELHILVMSVALQLESLEKRGGSS